MHQALGSGGASDGELARHVAAATPDATEAESELCRRLGPRVRLCGLRHLRDAAAADDLVQEVLGLDRARLRKCLARLGQRERTVLVLTFYAERPSTEIAARRGTSPENVRTVRHRAFGRLRDCVTGRAA
jgi:DNA-directed RNA polymerase specialized sigma24 family protein